MKTRPLEVAIERRFAPLSDVELRAENGIYDFRGHAALFNQETNIMGLWREQVAPGTFDKTIRDQSEAKNGPGVAFLYNHEPDSVMARTGNGTLRLSEDNVGLLAEASLDSSDLDVKRLVPKLESRNVSQMSFAFRVIRDEWEEPEQDSGELPLRTIREVQLFDVSPVTFPAYEGTDAELVSVRSLLRARPDVCEIVDTEKAAQYLEATPKPPDKDSPATEQEDAEPQPSDTRKEEASTEEPGRDEHPPFDEEVYALQRLRLEQLEATLR